MVGFRLPKWMLMLATGAVPLATVTTCDLGRGGASLLFDRPGHDCCWSDDVIIIQEDYVYWDDYWYEDEVYVEEVYIVEEEIIYEEVFYDEWFF